VTHSTHSTSFIINYRKTKWSLRAPFSYTYTFAKLEKEGYKRVERTYGSFYRRFSLPDTANAEAISAASKHGVLEVIIPKREAVQPKKIAVTAAE
jgi:hypothetical protein